MTEDFGSLADRHLAYMLGTSPDVVRVSGENVAVRFDDDSEFVIGNAAEFLLFMTGNASDATLALIFGSKTASAVRSYHATMKKVPFEEVELTLAASGY